jgi:hypothetical protein
VFQASAAERSHYASLELVAGKPVARWVNSDGTTLSSLASSTALAADQPTTVAFISSGSTQTLRVGGASGSPLVSTASVTLPTTAQFDQILLGSGFHDVFPRPAFGGYLFAAVTGSGTPTDAEMRVLERYLLAGTT